MLRHDEVTAGGDLVDPAAKVAVVDLDDAVAARADEVMMMSIGAEPVAELAAVVGQRVHDAVVAKHGECPVDGCETE